MGTGGMIKAGKNSQSETHRHSCTSFPKTNQVKHLKKDFVMKHCNLLIIGSDESFKEVKLPDFDFPGCMEILTCQDRHLKTTTIRMMRSDLIVTLENWQDDEKCKKLIEIARIVGIKVVHHSIFKNYVQQNHY